MWRKARHNAARTGNADCLDKYRPGDDALTPGRQASASRLWAPPARLAAAPPIRKAPRRPVAIIETRAETSAKYHLRRWFKFLRQALWRPSLARISLPRIAWPGPSARWTVAGFALGVVFWHFVGFWNFVGRVVLPSDHRTALNSSNSDSWTSAPIQTSGTAFARGHSKAPRLLMADHVTLTAAADRHCISLTRDPRTGHTSAMPCMGASTALREGSGLGRTDLLVVRKPRDKTLPGGPLWPATVSQTTGSQNSQNR